MIKYMMCILLSFISITLVSAQLKDQKISNLYQNYIDIKTALVSDNKNEAAKYALEFIKTASSVDKKIIGNKLAAIKKTALAISESKNIDEQRKIFHQFSDQMMVLAKEFKVSDTPVYVQYCPMAEGSWLSNESKIANPYYGKSMLTCGNVKTIIK